MVPFVPSSYQDAHRSKPIPCTTFAVVVVALAWIAFAPATDDVTWMRSEYLLNSRQQPDYCLVNNL